MEKEIFKVYADNRSKVNGCLWEVSNYGRVRKNGEDYNSFSERGNGYLDFSHNIELHRVVAELFVPNPDNKPTVDHINRNRKDNRACNLRWATRSEQMKNRDKWYMPDWRKKEMSEYSANCVWVIHPTNGDKHFIKKEHLENYLDNGYVRGKSLTKKIWVTNTKTGERHTIEQEQLQSYLDNGYIRGKK